MSKIEFEIRCTECGLVLKNVFVENKEKRRLHIVNVTPCPRCLRDSYNDGGHDGFDTGMNL